MKKVFALIIATIMLLAAFAACSSEGPVPEAAEKAEEIAAEDAAVEEVTEEPEEAEPEETAEEAITEEPDDVKSDAEENGLADGEYEVSIDTDSSMFHVNETLNGKGILTVKDGSMSVHMVLVSKNIVNLFPGLAEDAEKEGAVLLEPVTDTVTYDDGYTEEVYGFDIPVPALDEEMDLAILGTKGKWYDHKISVSAPEPLA